MLIDKLKLTEEHKDKLLEMCNELIGECYVNGDDTIGFRKHATESIDIHWLEICLVHLPKVLATPNNRAWDVSSRQAYHLQEFYHHPRHVVDYLYSEYQKKSLWTKTKKK